MGLNRLSQDKKNCPGEWQKVTRRVDTSNNYLVYFEEGPCLSYPILMN